MHWVAHCINMNFMTSTNLYLVGGIGNQLYGIYAGLYIRELCGIDVNFKYLISSVNKHPYVLSGVNFSREILINHEEKTSKLESYSRKIHYLSRSRSRVLNQYCNTFTSKYFSPVIGFDEEISKFRDKSSIEGYFQTYIYYDELRNAGLGVPFLTEKSKWFIEYSAIMEKMKPVVLHIRLGDYLNHPKVFVKLNSDYYSTAILSLPKYLQDNPIWIFSDNELLAKEFIKYLPSRNYQIIGQSKQKSSEVLFLMSQGIAHIIANSTFSWWAAKLNEKTKLVIAPKNWFINRKVPRQLLHDEWILI
jgi:hypothetical protein